MPLSILENVLNTGSELDEISVLLLAQSNAFFKSTARRSIRVLFKVRLLYKLKQIHNKGIRVSKILDNRNAFLLYAVVFTVLYTVALYKSIKEA